MRRGLIAAVTILAGCASAGPPPGGPENRTPPRLVRITPDTNAVNVHDRVATFYFDKVINDRGTGAQEVPSYFLVSPSDGTPRVNTHRSRIDVRPRHGFRENTAYTITMLPGLTDLQSNAMKTGATLVFSTGPTIPTLRINGIAFDWVAERAAPRALIEAISKDSVVYLAQADTLGNFSVGPLNPGPYLVRATVDQNQNRTLDRGEAWDSVRVVAPQTAPVELLTASRDTLPAMIQSVAVFDSVTVRLTFDRLLDPAQPFPVANFRVVGPDSASVPIVSTRTPRDEAEIAKRTQSAATDSARRADSLAGRAAPPVSTAVPALPTTRNAATTPATPKPSRPAPFTALTLVLGKPLPPNTNYVARVTTVRALSGRASASERRFVTPRPRAPSDSTTTTAPGPARPARPAAPGAPAPPADPRTTPSAPPVTPPPSRP